MASMASESPPPDLSQLEDELSQLGADELEVMDGAEELSPALPTNGSPSPRGAALPGGVSVITAAAPNPPNTSKPPDRPGRISHNFSGSALKKSATVSFDQDATSSSSPRQRKRPLKAMTSRTLSGRFVDVVPDESVLGRGVQPRYEFCRSFVAVLWLFCSSFSVKLWILYRLHIEQVENSVRRYVKPPCSLIFARVLDSCCSRHSKHRYMIDPHHPFNTFWDYVLSLLCIYVAITIPFRIGFQVELCPEDAWWWLELTVDCAFATDVVLNFRTGILEQDGVTEMHPHAAAKKYMMSWFLIDLLSVLPVTYIALMVTGECGEGANIKLFKVIRLVRLLKMLKLGQLRNVWAMYEREFEGMETAGKLIKVLFAAVIILYFSHLVACMWFYFGTAGVDPGRTAPTGWIARAGIVTKLNALDAEEVCAGIGNTGDHNPGDDCDSDIRCVFSGSGVCVPAEVTAVSDQYLESFYWSITVLSTVGFGDITPVTRSEKVFAILAVSTIWIGHFCHPSSAGACDAR